MAVSTDKVSSCMFHHRKCGSENVVCIATEYALCPKIYRCQNEPPTWNRPFGEVHNVIVVSKLALTEVHKSAPFWRKSGKSEKY